jgi:hypothetical protein
METIDKVNWWVRQTIPQVYSDDMSFLELTNSVMNKLNEVIDKTNGYFSVDMSSYVTNLMEQWRDDGTLSDSLNRGTFNAVSVKMYGAVADGNFHTGAGTDNTQAFQNAINSLAKDGGGSLIVPAGIYKIGYQITVPDGVSIIGMGQWTTILFTPTGFSNLNGLIAINGTGGQPTEFKGFGVLSQEGGCGGSGIVVTKNGVFLSELWVSGFNIDSNGTGIDIRNTDVFLNDFAVEYCSYGVTVKSAHVNVDNGTTYYCTRGVSIQNGSSTESGEVIIEKVRANACYYLGFEVSAGNNVTFIGCSAGHVNTDRFSFAGFYFDTATNIIVSACKSIIRAGQSTAANGFHAKNCTGVQIVNCETIGFYDGVKLENGQQLTVNGGLYKGNTRNGVEVQGGDRVTLQGVQTIANGSGTTGDAGIYLNSTAGYSLYNVFGCLATQDGGGVQDIGFFINLVDNGAASGQINMLGNISQYNNTTPAQISGKTANVKLTGNIGF